MTRAYKEEYVALAYDVGCSGLTNVLENFAVAVFSVNV
jgi:hypothetical protein